MTKRILHFSQIRELPMGEYITFFSDVIKVINEVNHSIDSSDFETALDRVVANYSQLNEVKRKIMGNELTPEIQNIHELRIKSVRHVKSVTTSHLLSSDTNILKHAKLLDKWFRAHSTILPYGRRRGVTRSLQEFQENVSGKMEFVEAVEALHLQKEVNELIELNDNYISVYGQRSVLWGGENAPDIDIHNVKRDSLYNLKMLMNSISFHASVNPQSCHRLVRALNAESNRVRVTVLSAKTLRQQAKLENEGATIETAAAIHMMTDDNSVIAPATMPAEGDINKPAEALPKTAEALPKTVKIDIPKALEEEGYPNLNNEEEKDKKIS